MLIIRSVLNIIALMSLEIEVLRALLRLARRRTPPSMEQLLLRVDAEPRDVQRALAALARKGLVMRTRRGFGLSLTGFAVAVACAQARPVARPPIVLPRKSRRAA